MGKKAEEVQENEDKGRKKADFMIFPHTTEGRVQIP